MITLSEHLLLALMISMHVGALLAYECLSILGVHTHTANEHNKLLHRLIDGLNKNRKCNS